MATSYSASGNLMFLSGSSKKQYYFRLEEDVNLRYYSDRTAAKSGQKHLGEINLIRVGEFKPYNKPVRINSNIYYVIHLTGNGKGQPGWTFGVHGAGKLIAWIKALHRACCLPAVKYVVDTKQHIWFVDQLQARETPSASALAAVRTSRSNADLITLVVPAAKLYLPGGLEAIVEVTFSNGPLGLRLCTTRAGTAVHHVDAGGQAEARGVTVGDLVLTVGDVPTAGMAWREVFEVISGVSRPMLVAFGKGKTAKGVINNIPNADLTPDKKIGPDHPRPNGKEKQRGREHHKEKGGKEKRTDHSKDRNREHRKKDKDHGKVREPEKMNGKPIRVLPPPPPKEKDKGGKKLLRRSLTSKLRSPFGSSRKVPDKRDQGRGKGKDRGKDKQEPNGKKSNNPRFKPAGSKPKEQTKAKGRPENVPLPQPLSVNRQMNGSPFIQSVAYNRNANTAQLRSVNLNMYQNKSKSMIKRQLPQWKIRASAALQGVGNVRKYGELDFKVGKGFKIGKKPWLRRQVILRDNGLFFSDSPHKSNVLNRRSGRPSLASGFAAERILFADFVLPGGKAAEPIPQLLCSYIGKDHAFTVHTEANIYALSSSDASLDQSWIKAIVDAYNDFLQQQQQLIFAEQLAGQRALMEATWHIADKNPDVWPIVSKLHDNSISCSSDVLQKLVKLLNKDFMHEMKELQRKYSLQTTFVCWQAYAKRKKR